MIKSGWGTGANHIPVMGGISKPRARALGSECPHPASGNPLPPARHPEDLCSKSNGYGALGRRAGGRWEGEREGAPEPTAGAVG